MANHLEFPEYYLRMTLVKESLKELFLLMENDKEKKIINFYGGTFLSKRKILLDLVGELGVDYLELTNFEQLKEIEKPTIIHLSEADVSDQRSIYTFYNMQKNKNIYFIFSSNSGSTTYHLEI